MSSNGDMRDEEVPEDTPTPPPEASEDPVHDQLPSVEEIRMTAAQRLKSASSIPGAEGHSSRTPWIIFGVVVLTLVAIIIGLSVGLVQKDNGSGREPRYDQVREWLIENDISDPNNLGRPEWEATVKWIADQDGRYLPLPYSKDSQEGIEFVNRYVAALLYFTMDGENWEHRLNFLQDIDHCDWNQVFTTPGDRLFRIGANCDIPGQITELHICKYCSRIALYLSYRMTYPVRWIVECTGAY